MEREGERAGERDRERQAGDYYLQREQKNIYFSLAIKDTTSQ